MLILLHSLLALLVLATIIPLSRQPYWWIRGLDFPRLQLLVVALLLVLAYLCTWFIRPTTDMAILSGGTLSLVCAIDHARRLLPYARFWRPELDSCEGDTALPVLRLMVANVLMTNRQYDALLAEVHAYQPDLVLFLEGDQSWETHLDVGLNGYPHALRCAKDNLYGMHLYSRVPLENAQVRYRVESDIPSMVADLCLPGNTKLLLHCVHPAPPSPTENEESSERDAELVKIAKELRDHAGPALVMGDFNDVPWSRATRLFRKLSGLTDPRVGRHFLATFHAHFSFFRWPLDHVFCSDHFSVVSMRRSRDFGSDHFALLLTLALTKNDNGDASGCLDEEAADQRDADEIERAVD